MLMRIGFCLAWLLCFWLAAGTLFRHFPPASFPKRTRGTVFVVVGFPMAPRSTNRCGY